MINLRYHIVSLTAVFLAIGIGLTLGSTFLDRATVDNLNGQLETLADRLDERDAEIGRLEDELAEIRDVRLALDAQGTGLLAGVLDGIPVVVLGAEGVEQADVDQAVQALLVAGAQVQGRWLLTERFLLADDADVADLATAIGVDSRDPARLRRVALTTLGGDLRNRQQLGLASDADEPDTTDDVVVGQEDPAGGDGVGPDGTAAPTSTVPVATEETTTTAAPDAETAAADDRVGRGSLPIVDALIGAGFLEFQAVAGGPEGVAFPRGTRLVVVGGSPDLPDDLALRPLVERLARATDDAVLAVVASAMEGDDQVSDIVAVVREDESLRAVVSSVDHLEHFPDWAALVLALDDLGDGLVGHYGLTSGATRLLPPLRGT